MPRKNKARSIIIKILLCITWAFWVCGVMLLTQFVLAKLEYVKPVHCVHVVVPSFVDILPAEHFVHLLSLSFE